MKPFLRLPISFLFFLLFVFAYYSQVSSEELNTDRQKVTLFKVWRYMEGSDEEIITFTPQKFQSRLSGPALPQDGLEMEKPIAKIVPNPSAKEGMLVLGPDETQSQPYKVMHWYDLTSDEVKLFFCPFVFASVEAATKPKCEKKYSKTYRALLWGI